MKKNAGNNIFAIGVWSVAHELSHNTEVLILYYAAAVIRLLNQFFVDKPVWQQIPTCIILVLVSWLVFSQILVHIKSLQTGSGDGKKNKILTNLAAFFKLLLPSETTV